MTNTVPEQTLVLIKPDALKNSLTGYVLSQLSEFHTGLRFAGLKVVRVSAMLADEHYAEHRGKVFFPPLLEYIRGRIHFPGNPAKHRVIAIVYQGDGAIQKIRALAGPTNPHVAREEKPGCIRSMGTVVMIQDETGKVIGERMDNLIHASASPEEAEREIKLWFTPNDLPPSMQAYETEESDAYFCFGNGSLLPPDDRGAYCFLVPGQVAWKSDLEILSAHSRGETASDSLESVVAKYLINDRREADN